MRKLMAVCFILFALAPAMLCAQENAAANRRFGLTFPNIGVIWHLTDNVAFLPGLNFDHSWGSSDDFSKNSSNSLGVDASLRFYLQEWKGVRLYLSPKYSYSWSDGEAEGEFIDSLAKTSSTTHNHAVTGAWGLQYAISDRISIWGDIGVRYRHAMVSTSSPNISLESRSNSVTTVGSWGLMLYLK